MILAEEFSHEIYRKSLGRLFELDESGHLQMYFNATFDVVASKVIMSQPHCVVRNANCNNITDNRRFWAWNSGAIISGENRISDLNIVYAYSWHRIICPQDSSQRFVCHDVELASCLECLQR